MRKLFLLLTVFMLSFKGFTQDQEIFINSGFLDLKYYQNGNKLDTEEISSILRKENESFANMFDKGHQQFNLGRIMIGVALAGVAFNAGQEIFGSGDWWQTYYLGIPVAVAGAIILPLGKSKIKEAVSDYNFHKEKPTAQLEFNINSVSLRF